MSKVLAQFDLVKPRFPKESVEMAGFYANVDRINSIAESSDGFIWRETNEDQEGLQALWGEGYLYTLSVWDDVASLKKFLYHTPHAQMLSKGHEWFHKIMHPRMVLWWVRRGHVPSLLEAHERLTWLFEKGASYRAFDLKNSYGPISIY
ncbi:DUF3291 domain-containing protein [Pseudomonas sp. SWRI59]|uniref:DUF3291 domain-containing protein n=1 Tax=unclassified Pseudomonas TaxID=196821 RepID=UPI0016486466|nr:MULTISPECIES: DUF3291 domain-containing protein [unclassified Pseudomonas]MBC3502172.1 DUF3291 domain-containing protein [Pseudomonas sp. SWRI59]MBC3506070.1 DUF3291 domain-containing protein [Pseudomonas sp. SWRI68]